MAAGLQQASPALMVAQRSPEGRGFSTSRRAVIIGLLVSVAETVALGVTAVLTNSAAMKTQTATVVADVAGGVFLLVGVLTSGRAPDEAHPLGYGRERFFWSFVAAVGSFVGGFGAAVVETLQAAGHSSATGDYATAYLVLGVVVALESVSLGAGLRPLLQRAKTRHVSVSQLLWRGTDPAVTTVVLGGTAGVGGGCVAAIGLVVQEATGLAVFDTLASGLIGVMLLFVSVVMLRTNRELLTGRGMAPAQVEHMRAVVLGQHGVVDVPDLFAIVIGPASLLVDGDVVFDDALQVPEVEAAIASAADQLRARWSAIAFVYLTPVASPRRDRGQLTPTCSRT